MTKTELHQLVDACPPRGFCFDVPGPRRCQLDTAPYDDEGMRAVKEARGEPGISWSDARWS